MRLTWRELLFPAAFASASSFNLLACRGNISDKDDLIFVQLGNSSAHGARIRSGALGQNMVVFPF